MISYAIRRCLFALITIFLMISLVFLAQRLMSGGPATAALGRDASEQAIKAFNKEYGLDRPVIVQYSDFFLNLLRGNLGTSIRTDQPVSSLLRHALPYTSTLAFGQIVIGIIIGLPFGIISAIYRKTWIDTLVRLIALTGISLPTFYIGLLFLLFFGLRLGWFPVMGAGDLSDFPDFLHHSILPWMAGGLYLGTYVTRFVRSSMLEELGKEYVITARSKGVKESIVLQKHVLRNGLIPLVTLVGLYVAALIGGTVLIEVVFSRPGMGRLLVGALQSRDFVVTQSIMAVYVTLVIAVNLLVDLSYGFLDPRIRYD